MFEDIHPDAVKIGTVSSAQIINVIAERLRFHQARNVVVDPVMVATCASALIEQQAVDALVSNLVPGRRYHLEHARVEVPAVAFPSPTTRA